MLFNFRLDFYELGGSLNWYIRPGWDRKEDMGSNYNIEGGRWIPHPYRGVDFTQFTIHIVPIMIQVTGVT